MATTGLLLVNLGTPDRPEPAEVGRYLAEFLMDPYVIRAPKPLRALLVHGLIVPRRRHASAALYRNIWTKEGSPLLVHSRLFAAKLQALLGDDWRTELAMRYGRPSLQEGMEKLVAANVDEIRVLPLYPQYALSSVETTLARCEELAKAVGRNIPVRYYKEFYDDPGYLDVLARRIQEVWLGADADHLVFSFHGLPENHVRATDPTGAHCFANADCCAHFQKTAPQCYRAQCYFTARETLKRIDVAEEQSVVAFQSRLGPLPWIRPFTDEVIKDLAAKGKKRVVVACPAFVADCLETLEEVSIRLNESFRAAGGELVILVPSLNERADWVQAMAHFIQNQTPHPLASRPRFTR